MKTEKREGREPTCPFCSANLRRPGEIRLSETERVLGGRCACGAVFLVDPTSKNVGEVMAQGLKMAADDLGKDLSEMVSGDDYEDEILSYNWRLHRSTGKPQSFMDGHGRLYIVRSKKTDALPKP